jgi:hypothetical protein
VLLQLPLAVGPAGLSLGDDPGAATFHLDLGEAGAASESVVSEPLREALLASGEVLDLPTVGCVSRSDQSPLIAGHTA